MATQEVKGSAALVVRVSGTSVGEPIDFDLEIVDGAPQVRLDGDLLYQGEAGDIADSGENYWKTGDDGEAMADVVGPDREVVAHGSAAPATTPDGSAGVDPDGRSDYLQVSGEDLPIAETGQLTVESLMRPDRVKDLSATQDSSEGPMVHVLNRGSEFGTGGDQEWATRVYDQDSRRPGRVSAYAFDPQGGEGAGSYDQSGLDPKEWVMATAVYDATTKGSDGWGTVTMYRDGVKVDTDTLDGDYQVQPKDGGSPLFVGGGSNDALFDGAIGVVAVCPTALSGDQVAAHAQAAFTPADEQDADADTTKGNDDEQQDAPTPGGRPIPIPDEKADATS